MISIGSGRMFLLFAPVRDRRASRVDVTRPNSSVPHFLGSGFAGLGGWRRTCSNSRFLAPRAGAFNPYWRNPMHKLVLLFALLLTTLFALPITPAQAQNQRSWVASYGSGSTCSRAAPCADFATALGQTNAGGEINCVDQGDFGSGGAQLQITKSITIDCEGVQGRFGYIGGGAAIAVNVAATDAVALRGLDIDGNGVANSGIAFDGGAALHVEKCVIHNFAGGGFGWGIVDERFINTTSELFVSDTVLENNGTASSGGGILIVPEVANAVIRVTLNRVEARNGYFGIKADATFVTGGVINMTVRDSVSSGNRSNGIVATGNASGPAIIMMVERTTSSQNATAGFGVIADGPKSTITLTGSTVMGNINGVGASNGGQLISFQDNKVILNSTNGTPTSIASPE
jgi:hypothetical protein